MGTHVERRIDQCGETQPGQGRHDRLGLLAGLLIGERRVLALAGGREALNATAMAGRALRHKMEDVIEI